MEYSIYKISCKNPSITKVYIGATTCFKRRMYQHERNVIMTYGPYKHNYKIYQYIRNNGGWDNFKCEILETIKAQTKDEIKNKESDYIRNNDSINTVVPNRTMSEWFKINKQRIKEYKQMKLNCEICNKSITRNYMLRHITHFHK